MKSSDHIINLNTIVQRGADLVFNEIDDEIVILSLVTEEYYCFNPNYVSKN